MSERRANVFSERATQKLRSADDLDAYVRVTNPSVWVALIAILSLLAGLVIWGVFGSVVTSVSATGTVVEAAKIPGSAKVQATDPKVAVCFLSADDVVNVDSSDMADVGGELMRVADISPIPTSPDELDEALGSVYLADALFKDGWAYAVVLDGDASRFEESIPLYVNITTQRIPPITLILEKRG